MRGGAELIGRTAQDRGCPHQPELEFHAQDAAHRIVDPRHGNRALLRLGQRGVEQALPAIGRHRHVEPGVEAGRARRDRAAFDLAMAVPIAHDEAAKAHAALEHIGEQRTVAVVLHAVPTGKAGHDGERAGIDRGG
jgi:hypothetical protein